MLKQFDDYYMENQSLDSNYHSFEERVRDIIDVAIESYEYDDKANRFASFDSRVDQLLDEYEKQGLDRDELVRISDGLLQEFSDELME